MSLAIHIEPLQNGNTVKFRPHGNSMKGRIESGQLVTVSPDITSLKVGDAVFCKVKGNIYVHLVTAINGDRYQIGNNRGGINGWTHKSKIYGKVVAIED